MELPLITKKNLSLENHYKIVVSDKCKTEPNQQEIILNNPKLVLKKKEVKFKEHDLHKMPQINLSNSSSKNTTNNLNSSNLTNNLTNTNNLSVGNYNTNNLSVSSRSINSSKIVNENVSVFSDSQSSLKSAKIENDKKFKKTRNKIDELIEKNNIAILNSLKIKDKQIELSKLICKNAADFCLSKIEKNPKNRFINPFDSKKIPVKKISELLENLMDITDTDISTLIIMVIYFRRLVKTKQITEKSIHKAILIAFIIADKFNSDSTYYNSCFLDVLGIDLEELNKLEVHMLNYLDFNLCFKTEKYNKYYDFLCKE